MNAYQQFLANGGVVQSATPLYVNGVYQLHVVAQDGVQSALFIFAQAGNGMNLTSVVRLS